MKHIASNFAKLDNFKGVDFRRWQKKMLFLLFSMSVVYVLTTPIPEDGGDDATVEQIRNRAKWDNDDYVCRDFKHTLKHKKEKLTLVKLGNHLRIEESLRMQDSDNKKGNNVAGPSVVNMVEHNNSSMYNDNKGKLPVDIDINDYCNDANKVSSDSEKNENKEKLIKTLLSLKWSERWNLTASGYFVGYRMAPKELRYNIKRMWGKFKARDIIVNNDGACLFKLRDINGRNSVIDKGPWMVNNKPLFVKKWNHEIGMQMSEHSKIPIWVIMTDVPLEAWSADAISALASSLGNPLIMDIVIATICHNGMGRLDYARVLVKMDADK
uniref:Zinc knuckle CX2CX4HX4C n=1 Tax=Tanacetum cinerariifolium TaxID=118510 RepID=A0A6L2KUT9_TANCI|nr:zinc knuckle CX2CX4HX4C [Tanacetum cinerariifolium]